MLVIGEVHTGLLRGHHQATASLVDLVAGEPVRSFDRPRAHVRSPDRPVGVDCPLGAPTPARRVRGIGTVLQRAAITGGHVVQGTAWATVVPAGGGTRQPWPYYLARPGVIEAVGRARPSELAAALAATEHAPEALDLGAIAGRASDLVQAAVPPGDRSRERLRLPRTRLRFVVERGETTGPPVLTVHGDRSRILRAALPAGTEPRLLAAFAEDLALHDWLLTSVIGIVDRAAIGALPRDESLRRLRPAVDHLLHLWLPAGRGGELARQLWETLDRHAALSRQWSLLRDRIRDQFIVGAVAALSAMPR
ncbi:SCO2521 family protein [Actinoplanes sp. G11-F43]|uniref:SCO2521 family protein n=1 Tax=Actinoplanes sp. G11-F43 TaxID=3424130 RepID=UPI003D3487AD